MIRRLTISLALTLAFAAPAGAYTMTCAQAVALVRTGDSANLNVVVGHGMGVLDFAAALVCLGNGGQCNCLSNLFTLNASALGREYGSRLSDCAAFTPNRAAFDPAFKAVSALCGL